MSAARDLAGVARSVAERAERGEDVDVMVSTGRSTIVRVHGGEVESFTSAESFAIGIRVISDHRQGFAAAGSIDPDVIAETLSEARDNVRFGERDDCFGLAEPDGVAAVEHDHWDDALVSMSADEKIERARALEARALAADPRVTGVRTATWSDVSGETAYATSRGLAVSERGASCSVGLQVLAHDGTEPQTGAAGDAARRSADLDDARIVDRAVERATRLFGATKPSSCRTTIVLEPRLAMTLLGIFAGMVDGESVLKGRSPFADRSGETVASPLLTLLDDPTDRRSIAASSFDGEGLACRPNPLLDGGVLGPFLQNSYTARRTATRSTASALRSARSLPGVGAQVLIVQPGTTPVDELIAGLDDGVFVTSLQGLHSGVNPVSGDFSVGADGLMIAGGSIGRPVREFTLASTIQRMLAQVLAVGDDLEWLPSGDASPTLAIGDVALSGS